MFGKTVLETRFEGLLPREISEYFQEEFEIYLYPGDIFGWLDSMVHKLQAVRRIAQALKADQAVTAANKAIHLIEDPKRKKRLLRQLQEARQRKDEEKKHKKKRKRKKKQKT